MTDDYIPAEIEKEALDFVKQAEEDVHDYSLLKQMGLIKKPDISADKFVAWWNLHRYNETPHTLIFLYENYQIPVLEFGSFDEMNVDEIYVFKFKWYWEHMIEEGLITDD